MAIQFNGSDFEGDAEETTKLKSDIKAFLGSLPKKHIVRQFALDEYRDKKHRHRGTTCLVLRGWHGSSEHGPWITCALVLDYYITFFGEWLPAERQSVERVYKQGQNGNPAAHGGRGH